MDIKKLCENLLYKIGSEVMFISKEKYAPIVSGNLKKDIQVKKVSAALVEIGNTQRASYAKWVHGGTKPYVIKPKNKKALANKKAGLFFGKKVNHPGIKANPYLEKALNEYVSGRGLDRALEAFKRELGEEIKIDIEKKFK